MDKVRNGEREREWHGRKKKVELCEGTIQCCAYRNKEKKIKREKIKIEGRKEIEAE